MLKKLILSLSLIFTLALPISHAERIAEPSNSQFYLIYLEYLDNLLSNTELSQEKADQELLFGNIMGASASKMIKKPSLSQDLQSAKSINRLDQAKSIDSIFYVGDGQGF